VLPGDYELQVQIVDEQQHWWRSGELPDTVSRNGSLRFWRSAVIPGREDADMKWPGVVALTGLSLAGALAQEPAPPKAAAPPADILSRRIVLAVDGMDRVVVRRNLLYRVADDLQLPMDVYIPPGLQAGARRPAVIFIHGGPMAPDMSPTEWGVYRSYGELAAASGFVGITFKHRLNSLGDFGRAAGDVRALIDHVRANAAALHVDPDRVALWGFSGGGALLGVAFQQRTPFVRCVVSYYGILDLREPAGSGMPPAVPEPVASELSPVYLVAHSAGPFPPTLIARAGRDNPRINLSVDDFVRAAVTSDVSLDLLTLPQGQHAFDVLDDTARSREVIERTVAYLRANLERASSAKQQ
jgi:acetyl esterase/lipase